MRKVDKLGRIVIPLELRNKYGLCEGASVEFLDSGEGVTVRSADHFCKICRSKIPVGAAFPLCIECITKVLESYNGKT